MNYIKKLKKSIKIELKKKFRHFINNYMVLQ
jgi:hypothetical protein